MSRSLVAALALFVSLPAAAQTIGTCDSNDAPAPYPDAQCPAMCGLVGGTLTCDLGAGSAVDGKLTALTWIYSYAEYSVYGTTPDDTDFCCTVHDPNNDLDGIHIIGSSSRDVIALRDIDNGTGSQIEVLGTSFQVNVDAGGGPDDIWGSHETHTQYTEVLHGDAGNDDIHGGNSATSVANDWIHGDDGHDDLWGNGGADIITGGNGRDDIWGGNGEDTLYGDAANDRMWGGNQGDYMYGGAGNDRMWGNDGVDVLYGDHGHYSGPSDPLIAQAGNDLLVGGLQGDWLFGDPGDDTLDGGPGDDILHGDDWQSTAGVGGDDTLLGGNNNDQLRGHVGRDRLQGNDGYDSLYGGEGADWLCDQQDGDQYDVGVGGTTSLQRDVAWYGTSGTVPPTVNPFGGTPKWFSCGHPSWGSWLVPTLPWINNCTVSTEPAECPAW